MIRRQSTLLLRSAALLAVLATAINSIGLVKSFSTLPTTHDNTSPQRISTARSESSKSSIQETDSNSPPTIHRSAFLSSTVALFGLLSATPAAHALKKKNEALCGTGFFEHIYEYKCTAIGDIEDEGTSKGLSQSETGLTDSLMGKLDLGSDAVFVGDNKNSGNTKPKNQAAAASTETKSGAQ